MPPAADFFDRIRSLGVTRPDEGRWLAGVCAGLARRWALDPLLVRGLFLAIGLVTGIGLGVYGLLWLFLPHRDGRIHAQQVLRGEVTAGFVGAALSTLSLGAWGGTRDGWLGAGGAGGLIPLVILGGVVWWLARGRHSGTAPVLAPSTPPPPPGASGHGSPSYGSPSYESPSYGSPAYGSPAYGSPAYGSPAYGSPAYGSPTYSSDRAVQEGAVLTVPMRPVDGQRPLHALTLSTLGLAVLAGAGILAWDRTVGSLPRSPALVAAAVALGVVSLGIVTAGVLGRRSGGLAPVAILLAVVSVNAALWGNVPVHSSGTDVTWTPASSTAAAGGYTLGAGRAVLQLTDPGLTTGATAASPVTLPVSLGVGELVIVVPPSVPVEVESWVGLGNLTDGVSGAGGKEGQGGAGLHLTRTYGTGTAVVHVEAKTGLGRIWIVPQGTAVTR